MKTHKCRLVILSSLLFSSQLLFGQGTGGGSNIFIYSLIALGVILLIWAILNLTDKLLQVEAKKQGADLKKNNFSIFPSLEEIFSSKSPAYAAGEDYHRLKKGFDIKLAGEPNSTGIEEITVTRFSLNPPNFRGIAPIPKVIVKQGDEVKAGEEIFFDKSNPDIKYVSPVSGEIMEIRRGAKRAITNVVILADKDQQYIKNDIPSLESNREDLVAFMMKSGLWPLINQRPFDIIADPQAEPKNIFISTFDSAPLAPSYDLIVDGYEGQFQKGLDVLQKLTSGKVHLGLDARTKNPPHSAFKDAQGVEKHYFNGPHPSGNVGVQIHHIDSIKHGDVVWTLKVQDVIILGEMFLTGEYKARKVVAITGAEIKEPKYVITMSGANIGDLLKGQMEDDSGLRIINGNVLTGRKVDQESFLDFHNDVITVIKEGDYYEPFGWLLPLKPRPSISSSYPNFLFPNHKFTADTNTHGEKRAFVVTGQYESVMPMDVYPQHIMKSIMVNDIEMMEGLGITELSEEDVALCEFVCTSKMPLQSLLRQGLDMLREQS